MCVRLYLYLMHWNTCNERLLVEMDRLLRVSSILVSFSVCVRVEGVRWRCHRGFGHAQAKGFFHSQRLNI